MTFTRNQGLSLVAGGMLLVVASLVMGKADEPVFGVSSDFLAGFLLGAGLMFAAAGVAALTNRRNSS